ncbi:ADP-dependent NAD(P)H-hydrate dehydratase [Microcella indica]|jgi:ADP-dependent NAD(P)H-hydrate dehydratase / NAD(P)H-hydrate epimerase|uniref:ADP-dependent NAD(P)H-hydrate dehydratase n=1 Tax=Microcella indica TaxID=2750620 RepID=UPI0015CF08F7|nr:ADP/ATP-dependent (S)-NAD(P)H-hydrate dehydratase [Microcella indica]
MEPEEQSATSDDSVEFGLREAADHLAEPGPTDDKYSRGVLGVVSGSAVYPGAAVLTVEAALRTGVGMLRYLGPSRAAEFVLHRRPEVVTAPGRVQAWLLGSGMPRPDEEGGADSEVTEHVDRALSSGLPIVLDAGALARAEGRVGPMVLTPHAGELARLLGVERASVEADPVTSARTAAQRYGATVLLKGHRTTVVGPTGAPLHVEQAPAWLATAGAGDALAGILGALVATHSQAVLDEPGLLGPLAATAAVVHGRAARAASGGGPFTVLDLCGRVGPVIAELLVLRA